MLAKTKTSLDKEKHYANTTKSRLDQTSELLAKTENELRTTQDTLSKKSEKLDKCEDRIKRFEKSIQDEINASVGSIVEKNKELITQMSDLQQENTEKD